MKNIIKKISLFVFVAALVFTLIGCSFNNKEPEKEDHAPVFHGVEDVTIEKGASFKPLEGVSVTDEEDGNINVSLVKVDASSVNVNVEGEYIVTYTVYDSDGNKTVVERKVTVVFIDKVAPELYGVGNINVTIGDTSFTELKNVSAVDAIDGEVEVKVTGEVNVWVIGEYMLHYSAKDKEGNEATADRKVTVNLGNFEFGELENIPQSLLISGGEIIESIAPYTLIKVVLSLSGQNAEVHPTIEGTISADESYAVNGTVELVLYARLDEVLDNAQLALNATGEVTVNSAQYGFARSGDHQAPVITRAITGAIALPVGAEEEFAKSEILRGITAQDNIDGNVTSKLVVDFGEANLNAAGNYVVLVKVSDSLGNLASMEIELIIASPRDTNIMTDPGFDQAENAQIVCTHNAGGKVVEEIKDGMYVLNIETAGGWASGDSPYLKGLNTTQLQAGQFYMFQMDVKADVARTIQIRAGLELWSDPWIENFRDTTKFSVTEDWTTIKYIFYVPAEKSSDGSNVVKFEIQCGSIYWAAEENNNVLYFDNMQFYLLSNVNKFPEVSLVEGLPTTFAKDSVLPDFTTYFTASDLEDGEIVVTSEMIDLSQVDITTAGKYTIVCTVKDSGNQETSVELEINIIDEVDTEGPVITVPDAVMQTLASLMPVTEGTDLSDKFTMVLGYITITDNVDGNITPTIDMIDLGEFNIKSANVGTFELKMQTKDSSGNLSNEVVFTITVKDANPPVLVGARDLVLYVGQTYNPLTAVCGYDSNDGIIQLTLENLVGFEQVLDAEGKVIAEPGQYQAGFTLKDAAENEAEQAIVITVVEAIEFNKEIDLLAKKASVGGPTSSTIEYNDGIGTLTYNGAEGWYASYCQLKYYGVALNPNVPHKLVITAKAELPREFVIYFVDGDSNKIPGFAIEETGNKLKVGLTGEYATFEYLFTPTSASSSNSIFELDLDWESFLLNSASANVISIKELKIMYVGEEEPIDENYDSVLKLDFEDGQGSGHYVNDHWAQEKYANDAWQTVTNQMNSRSKDGSLVANMASINNISHKYTYTPDALLKNVSKFSIDLGNYYSGVEAPIKIVLVKSDDTLLYIVGSESEFYTVDVTTGMNVHLEKEFDACDVKAFYIVFKTAKSDAAYLYMDNVELLKAKGQGDDPTPIERNYESVLLVDFEEYTTNAGFKEAHWTQERYGESGWAIDNSEQMRSRGIGNTRVVNMASGGGIAMKYTYTPDAVLENIGKVEFKLSNHFDNVVDPIKVALVLEDDSVLYLIGSASEFYDFAHTDGLQQFEFELQEVSNVKAIYFSFKAASSTYLYLDDLNFFKVVEE